MSEKTKICPLCQTNIRQSQLERHLIYCNGLGTRRQQERYRAEQQIKYKQENNEIYVCTICSKRLNTPQGLRGHIQRSHNQRSRQKEYADKNGERVKQPGYIHPYTGFKHSEETKKRMSDIACTRLAKHSKYSKNTEYKPGIILESSYEVLCAQILDSLKIEWIKVRQGFQYCREDGTIRKYIPDFYLPRYNLYLDPKNDYLIIRDKKKIENVQIYSNIKVEVLSKKQLQTEYISNLLAQYAPVV